MDGVLILSLWDPQSPEQAPRSAHNSIQLNSHNITPEHELKPKEGKVVEDADKAAAEKEIEEPKKDLDNMKKWKYTLITTVIFLIIASISSVCNGEQKYSLLFGKNQ